MNILFLNEAKATGVLEKVIAMLMKKKNLKIYFNAVVLTQLGEMIHFAQKMATKSLTNVKGV